MGLVTGINVQRAESTLNTLGNANELVRCIAQEVLGNEVADTIDGAPITRTVLYGLSQSIFAKHLSHHLGN